MWLGTYQPYYTKEELEARPDLDMRSDYPGFPFYPVWCIPCENPTDMFVASTLAAPRFPELFHMFETDDYVRIDKVKWYEYVNKVYPKSLDFDSIIADKDIPDIMCEFVVRKDVYESLIQENSMTAIVLSLYGFMEGKDFPVMFTEHGRCGVIKITNPDQFRASLKAMWDEMPDLDVPDEIKSCWDSAKVECTCLFNGLKILFERAILPFLYYANKGLIPESGVVSQYCLHNPCRSTIDVLYRRFYEWQEGCSGFDADEYMKYVNELRMCMPDNLDVLTYLCENGVPERNDPCPCGCGRKFKKCHGRYMV